MTSGICAVVAVVAVVDGSNMSLAVVDVRFKCPSISMVSPEMVMLIVILAGSWMLVEL